MSFHPITIGTKVFNETGPGRYTLSTLAISDPMDQVVISAGSRSKNGDLNAGVSRVIYLDTADLNGKISRRMSRVSLSLTLAQGITASTVDALVAELSTFLTPETLTRILLGEK